MEDAKEKELEQTIQQARIAHDARRRTMSESAMSVIGFGNAAMRAPAVAGAGGIAGMLGFFSANAALLRNTEATIHFNTALVAFFLAILICVAAPGLAYFSQWCFTESFAKEEYNWESPYVRDTPLSLRWSFVGSILRWVSIVLVVFANLALIVGAWQFLVVAEFIAR